MHINMPEGPCVSSPTGIFGTTKRDDRMFFGFVPGIKPISVDVSAFSRCFFAESFGFAQERLVSGEIRKFHYL